MTIITQIKFYVIYQFILIVPYKEKYLLDIFNSSIINSMKIKIVMSLLKNMYLVFSKHVRNKLMYKYLYDKYLKKGDS